MSMDRIEVITSVERRRRFSRAEKERWVLALMEPGANCSEVARQAGVDRSLLYRWRRELSDLARPPGALTSFVPVAIAPESAEGLREPSSSSLSPATMSIEFGASISMKIEGAPDADTLVNIINALSRTVARR
jgi:transposase